MPLRSNLSHSTAVPVASHCHSTFRAPGVNCNSVLHCWEQNASAGRSTELKLRRIHGRCVNPLLGVDAPQREPRCQHKPGLFEYDSAPPASQDQPNPRARVVTPDPQRSSLRYTNRPFCRMTSPENANRGGSASFLPDLAQNSLLVMATGALQVLRRPYRYPLPRRRSHPRG